MWSKKLTSDFNKQVKIFELQVLSAHHQIEVRSVYTKVNWTTRVLHCEKSEKFAYVDKP